MTANRTQDTSALSATLPSRRPHLHRSEFCRGRGVCMLALVCLGTASAFMGPAATPRAPATHKFTCSASSVSGMRLAGQPMHTMGGSTAAFKAAAANQLLLRYRSSRTGLLSAACAVKTKVSFENEFEREASSMTIHQTISPTGAGVTTTTAVPKEGTKENPELVRRMAEAKAIERSGDLKAAAVMLDGILEDFPAHGKVWMRRFRIAKRRRRFAEARDHLRRALKHVPGNAILWQAWADLEKSLGRHAVARRLYRKGLEANPRLASLYNSWGGMERDQGDVSRARALLRDGLRQNPSSARLLHSLGVLEDCAGNPALSRRLLEEGLLLEPSNAFLHHALAVLEFKQGRLSAARESLRRALTADKDHTMAWLAWGQLEEAEGNAQVARDKYREGCRARGGRGSVQLWQAWARLEEKSGEERAALALYGKASGLYPRDVRLLLEAAKLHDKRGDVSAALAALAKATAVDPARPYVYQVTGQLLLRQLRVGEARATFAEGVRRAEAAAARGRGARRALVLAGGGRAEESQEAQEVSGEAAGPRGEGAGAGRVQGTELASLLHAWASMEERQGDVDRARELFGRAVGADGSRGWLWRSLAVLEGAHGDAWLARHYFARAVNAEPREGDTWVAWSELEEAMNNHERARFYAKRGLELKAVSTLSRHRTDPARPLARRWFRD